MIVPCMVRNTVIINTKGIFSETIIFLFTRVLGIYIFPEINMVLCTSNFQQTNTSLYVVVARDCFSVECITRIVLSCLCMIHLSKVRFTSVESFILCILKGLAEFLSQARTSNLFHFTSFNSKQSRTRRRVTVFPISPKSMTTTK